MCSMLQSFDELVLTVSEIRHGVGATTEEVLGDIKRLDDAFSRHMTSLGEVIMRLSARLDVMSECINNLLTGVSDLATTTKVDLSKRQRKAPRC
jgi:hypothetical protein